MELLQNLPSTELHRILKGYSAQYSRILFDKTASLRDLNRLQQNIKEIQQILGEKDYGDLNDEESENI